MIVWALAIRTHQSQRINRQSSVMNMSKKSDGYINHVITDNYIKCGAVVIGQSISI